MAKLYGILILLALLMGTVSVPSYSKEYSSRADQWENIVSIENISSSSSLTNNDSAKAYSRTDDTIIYAQSAGDEDVFAEEADEELDYLEEDEISDPFESVNRVFFTINDKLYFWVLKPVAKGYSTIVPEKVRVSLRHFFNNVATPIRLANNLLQMKFKPAGNELLRFGVNSTVGVLGLFDVAKSEMGLQMQDEDFGQTLGSWGLGPGFYINWPLLGPSTLRDSVGYAGDYFLDPINYITPLIDRYALKIGDRVNRTSLSIGDYEEIKKDAIDPYAAIRDIYFQYRQSKIDR